MDIVFLGWGKTVGAGFWGSGLVKSFRRLWGYCKSQEQRAGLPLPHTTGGVEGHSFSTGVGCSVVTWFRNWAALRFNCG
jgi:hypothetical protein